MKVSAYHRILRISALTLALVLLFDSGLVVPVTKKLSHNTQLYLANAVGVNASVARTDINTLSAEIAERDRQLDQREAALKAREIEVGLNTNKQNTIDSTFIMSVVLFILIVLIVLNYVLDFLRERNINNNSRHEKTA